MIKILFICHGNICRSPMGEFIFKDMARRNGQMSLFDVSSAATSREEIGNDIYPPAKRVLKAHGIEFDRRGARQVTADEMASADYVIIMDENNRRNLRRMFADRFDDRIHLLMDYTDRPGEVSDPWYTGDYETAYADIYEGCVGLYNEIVRGK